MLSSQLLLYTITGKALVTIRHVRSTTLSRVINLRNLNGHFSVTLTWPSLFITNFDNQLSKLHEIRSTYFSILQKVGVNIGIMNLEDTAMNRR